MYICIYIQLLRTMSAGDSRQAPSKSLYVLYLEVAREP